MYMCVCVCVCVRACVYLCVYVADQLKYIVKLKRFLKFLKYEICLLGLTSLLMIWFD